MLNVQEVLGIVLGEQVQGNLVLLDLRSELGLVVLGQQTGGQLGLDLDILEEVADAQLGRLRGGGGVVRRQELADVVYLDRARG